MARTTAVLPAGSRLTDFISLGLVAKSFPEPLIRRILELTERESQRERDLPAHVVVYYVIALALYMQCSYREVLRTLVEGVRWLAGPGVGVKLPGKSAIAQARVRLGVAPLRVLYETVARPVATRETVGAHFRDRWRVVSMDGTTFDIGDTEANAEFFGRPGASRGESAFPKARLLGLVETGTHVIFGGVFGRYGDSEVRLAATVVSALEKGMLCLADRGFLGFDLWRSATANGAELLWRAKSSARFPRKKTLSDGSWLSEIRWNSHCRSADRTPIPVRVVDYELPNHEGKTGEETVYRLVTTILEPREAPASELAALYHERWEIEAAFDELKTHLRGARIVLRSKTPEMVLQEGYGLLLAHYAVRGLMHEAALSRERDPDTVSFTHALAVVKRSLPHLAAFPP
jgi:hypothetical protein